MTDQAATFTVERIGRVRSELHDRKTAPRQGYEGAPEAWLEIEPRFHEALDGVEAGCDLIVVTWLHLAKRETLKVYPRGEYQRPLTGVFATRSPDRPNPIGLHRVTVLEVHPERGLRVRPLEALDETPILDIKAVLRLSRDE